MRRAFVITVDACGVGALPDAAGYGDAGANTLAHVASAVGGLRLPTLERLGLGSILALEGMPPSEQPVLHGRLAAQGAGKDSTSGHWELMGVISHRAPATYPQGFPPEVIDLVGEAGGFPVLCNRPYNGIEAIDHFGARSLEQRAMIVYTSQDSVLQVAAHEDVVPVPELHAVCERIRARLPSRHAVGRVIARPFTGQPGAFRRLEARRDFALPPPGRSYLQEVQAAGLPVHAVGKVGQLFSGVGIDTQHPGATNAEALEETQTLLEELETGLVFTNLIETDQVYGHRHDPDGFHRALQAIDAALEGWSPLVREQDLLILTADHGCDPDAPHTDHTREYVPLLAHFHGDRSRRHDGAMCDVGASVLHWLAAAEASDLPGRSFLPSGEGRH